MEHNTLIKYGFEKGIEQTVFDPETESHLAGQHNKIHPKFDFDEPKLKSTANKKRKATSDGGLCKKKIKHMYGKSASTAKDMPLILKSNQFTPLPPNNSSTKTSKPKSSGNSTKQTISSIHDPLPAGCIWSQADWSCAYDVFYMIFFYMHYSSTDLWTNTWRHYSPLAYMLHDNFNRLSLKYQQGHKLTFDQHRDELRDVLSACEPNIFPRHGHAAIDVTDIFEQLNKNGQYVCALTIQHICPHCNSTPPPTLHLRLSTTVHPAMLPCSLNSQLALPTPFTIQQRTNTLIASNIESHHLGTVCLTCSTNMQIATTLLQPSPYLHFEIPSEITNSVLPSRILTISNTNMLPHHYCLRGIIYHGQLHFTARLIGMDNTAWIYDGQLNMGVPVLEHGSSDGVEQLMTLQGRQPYIYIYQHMTHPPTPNQGVTI